jgi:endo-1,4-beta-xylanase
LLFAVVVNRRTFLRVGAGSTAWLLSRPAWCAQADQPKPSDADILAEAGLRIEQHRKGDGVILVRDAQGRPVPGAKVTVEQVRHDFLFGSNFFMFGRCRSAEREEQYRQRFLALLNYCTLPFYWASFEPERGRPDYEYIDRVAAWTRQHGNTAKGHPLVWDHAAGSPRWLTDDPRENERLSRERVREIVSRYHGRIDIWDVVNEATHLANKPNPTRMADWAAALGAVPYVTESLEAARAANPQATLLINDYRIEPAYYRILEQLRHEGKFLFDTVGLQSHMHGGVWPLHKAWSTCDTYSQLGLPLHFTESTIVSGPRTGPGEDWGATTPEGEARQAEQTIPFYTALFAHPSVQAITWWDFSDLGAWQGAAAGWLRRDMSPKPVYDRLLSLIKGEWWTKTQAITGADGQVKVRAFYGTQRIAAIREGERPREPKPSGATLDAKTGEATRPPAQTPAGQEVHWEKGGKNQFELTL